MNASQLLYGTDYPFGGISGIEANARALMETRALNDGDTRDPLRGNATDLFSRLRDNDPDQRSPR